ncbi:MAG: type I restriction enzyme HsdR N-terminal domain-containing protein [Schleiferiaceae bacterium]|nr:type I restriction enzyme HsdR N-terminal domain-containing protein [Schleiferiaceae bacterium]
MRKWLHSSMKAVDPLSPTLWDAFRRKDVKATPEEWVRQSTLRHLVLEYGYPAEVISVEKSFKVGDQEKRFDIAAFHEGQLILVVECKANSVKLGTKAADQWMRYNLTLQAPFGVVTNGKDWKIFTADGKNVAKIPHFKSFAS